MKKFARTYSTIVALGYHNFSSLLRRASQTSRSQIGINYEKLLVTRGGMLPRAW